MTTPPPLLLTPAQVAAQLQVSLKTVRAATLEGRLRHTAASWMVQEGVPLDVVQRILGHASMTTTLRYAHRADHAERDAVATLGRAMGDALAAPQSDHSPIPGHNHDTLGEDAAPQSAPKSLAHIGK